MSNSFFLESVLPVIISNKNKVVFEKLSKANHNLFAGGFGLRGSNLRRGGWRKPTSKFLEKRIITLSFTFCKSKNYYNIATKRHRGAVATKMFGWDFILVGSQNRLLRLSSFVYMDLIIPIPSLAS